MFKPQKNLQKAQSLQSTLPPDSIPPGLPNARLQAECRLASAF